MPTISGMRRRGYTPEAVRDFCARVGVAKKENVIDIGLLEHCVREDLNRHAPRAMAVLRPLKVVLTNYPADRTETMDVVNHPDDASLGTRAVRSRASSTSNVTTSRKTRRRSNFRARGARSRGAACANAYLITCQRAVKDAAGEIVELHCTYDSGHAWRRRARRAQGEGHPALGVGSARRRRRGAALRSALHGGGAGGSRREGGPAVPRPVESGSLDVLAGCKLEPMLGQAAPGARFQFERLGYFAADPDGRPGAPVFTRTVSLKDNWAKVASRERELHGRQPADAPPPRPPAWPRARRRPGAGRSCTQGIPRRPPLR